MATMNWLEMEAYCQNAEALRCIAEDDACTTFISQSTGLQQLGMTVALCTPETTAAMVRSMLPNATECEAACGADTIGTIGDYIQIMARDDMRLDALAQATAGDSRRLEGHGDLRSRSVMTEFLCPKEEIVRCIFGTAACELDLGGGPTPPPPENRRLDGHESVDEDGPLAILRHCNVVVAVSLTMELTVANPQTFVNDPNSATAVAQGIATAAGVDLVAVEVRLSVARRLDNHATATSGTVTVDATIQATDAASVSNLQDTVNAIEQDAMTEALNTALAVMGVTVTVNSMAAVEAAPAGGTSNPSGSNVGEGQTENGALKKTMASNLVVAVAIQLLFP